MYLVSLSITVGTCEARKGIPNYTETPPLFCRMSYGARAQVAKNALARQCLELMERKKTNLSVAADVDTAEEMLQLADKVS